MYQLWSFISPGLHETERRATLNYIPLHFFFCWRDFVFLFCLVSICDEIHDEFIRRNSILHRQSVSMSISRFLFQLLIPFGIVFQLPVVLLFLTRLGILNPTTLVKIRKYAYFILFVIAAFITPPDLFSHLFVTVPLFALYEISIFISRFGYRKYLKAEQQRQFEEAKAEQQRQIDEVNEQHRNKKSLPTGNYRCGRLFYCSKEMYYVLVSYLLAIF